MNSIRMPWISYLVLWTIKYEESVAKRIFHYLTSNVGLLYENVTKYSMTGYYSFDYVGFVDGERSMTSYVFTLGGFVVSWETNLLQAVTLYITKVECTTLIEVAVE